MRITIDTDGKEFYIKVKEHWESHRKAKSWKQASEIIKKEILPNAKHIE